ncbi:dimethylglycine dehydrogenase, mitochondrial-like [Glandiceps talaboti]
MKQPSSSQQVFVANHQQVRALSTANHQRSVTGKLQERVNDTAETVIVGGGALGTGTAYHLTKAGMKNVMLLEKTELTAGSTWHAAGLTTFYQPIINVKDLVYQGLKLYEQLEGETGQPVGLHQPGSIRLAKTPERVDEFRYQMHRHGWHNHIPQRIIWPEEIHKLHPLVNIDKVLAGLYMEGDGHIDPYSLTQAYAIGARKYGAEIYQQSPVLDLKQTSDGRWEVLTEHGTILSNRIVNATGLWSQDVGRMTGIEIPAMSVEHQYVVTSSIPEIESLGHELPVLRDLEDSYYLRQERTGFLIGPYEKDYKMKQQLPWLDGIPQGFGRELFDTDLDRISDNLDAAMELVPVLQNADIQTVVNGPMAFTPDSNGLVGPYPGLRNYWIINGMSGGIVWSGGLTKYLSDWILAGEPPQDLVDLDPSRYGKWTSREYLTAKTREVYGFINAISYPFEERFAGRPTKRVSGAYEKMKNRGAQFGLKAGWEQPNWFALSDDEKGQRLSFRRTNWFGPVGRECNLVMKNAGVIDLSSAGKFDIEGKDAYALLDSLCATNIPEVGESTVVHLLTHRGRIYSEITICRLAVNHFFCVTSSEAELHTIRWIEEQGILGKFEYKITNTSDKTACLGIVGPKSKSIVQELTDIDMESLKPMQTKTINVAKIPVFVIRASVTGELGYELYHDRQHTSQLYDALLLTGHSHGMADFGSYAANTMRLEKGYRVWGRELTVDYNPYEAGIADYININKETDFIGKGVLGSLRDNLNRKSVLLSIDSKYDNVDPIGYETVWYKDQVVGNTTSGAYSYSTNQGIALAYLPLHLTAVGSQVYVEMLGKKYSAQVLEEPLLQGEIRV